MFKTTELPEEKPMWITTVSENSRDYWRYKFAGKAMAGTLRSMSREGDTEMKEDVKWAVKYADALLEELEKE